MVSEIKRFHCQPDTTSSWFLRCGALQEICYDGFWKSDHKFLSRLHSFRDNEVLWTTGYDVIMIYLLRSASGIFYDSFWKSDHDFLIAFYSNVLSEMHGFRDYEVLLQGGYDVIVIFPLRSALRDFHDGFWKSDLDFLIAFHSKFVSGMHGFRDNDVLFQGGFDVIMISPLGSASGGFLWRFIVTFYLGCNVSEVTRFYCKVDMTSSWFLRKVALPGNF